MTPDRTLSAADFRRRFRWLTCFAWSIPPVVGLGFILLIRVLTPMQLVGILSTPLEPAYVLGWLAFALWYLPHKMQPLANWLDGRPGSDLERAIEAVRRFPLRFWATFLLYLVMAPVSVIIAAEIYTDFVATPIDYFRIELVALIVSIIVGLPIFFLVFDLFGKALGSATLRRPVFTIRTKVILIGALVPLLIDTMLVQYYWTRTGYFSGETFFVWLLLELIAVCGSLVFAHSFGQALAPLQGFLVADRSAPVASAASLIARSTDELGALTGDYRGLLSRIQLHGEILEINNQLLRRTGAAAGVETAFTTIVELCQQAIRCDQAFLIVHDPATNELVGVAQTGGGYRAEGHFRLRLDEPSLAVWTFNHRQTAAVTDTTHDPRVNPRMRERFGVLASLATPLWLEGEVQGVLMAVDRRPRGYAQRETALIEGLAREAALTLHTQRLRDARERAEAERREQAEQVRLLLNTTEEGIYGIDVNGVCTFINGAAVRMLGYARPEDLLGRSIHALIHHTYPDGRPYPQEQCRVRNSTLGGLPSHADDEVHWRADGTSFPVEFWSHPIHRDGKLTGAVVTFVDITARKRAEDLTRSIHELNQSIINSAQEGIIVFDRDLRYRVWNPYMEQMMGRKAADMLGRHPDEVVPFLRDAGVVGQLERALGGEIVREFEVHFVVPTSGESHWDLSAYQPIRDAAGATIGVLALVRDITERKRAEAALLDSKRHFEALVEASPVGVFEADLAGACTFVNARWSQISGLSSDQARGDGWASALHPGDRDTVFSAWQEAARLQRPVQLEFRLRQRAGKQTWVLGQTTPLRDRDGKITGYLGTMTDITDLKNAEHALRETEARYRLLFETMALGVVYQGPEGGIEEANPAAQDILGLTLDQMQGRTSMDPRWRAVRDDGSDFPGDEHPAMVALHTGQPVGDVVMGVFHPQYRAYRWISINATPQFRRGESAPYRVYTTFADITARREAEKRIRQINEELETRVAQRTAELRAARDVAEQANLAKSEFLSRMSHELRTPLNAILGFAQILRMRGETATAAQREEQMGHIEKAGWHLLELINEVLDLSRIESGTMVVSREPVELQRLCAECVQMVQPLTRAARISVMDETAAAAPLFALADRTRLNQVLMNLLSNAVKYNQRGGSITLTLHAVDEDWVDLSVADTGRGFTAEQLRNLYQPFNRLGAEHGATEGTGIGLVITRRLTELMGGSIELTTKEGAGSRFTLRLARARPGVSGDKHPQAVPPAAARSPRATHAVLYIEDNPSNVDLVRSALAWRPGTRVVAAPDGPTGLAMVGAERPDLILVDIALPGIDGYEVCRRLRARADTANTPVVALSSNALKTDIERGREAGFTTYLIKPLDVPSFLALVDRLLG